MFTYFIFTRVGVLVVGDLSEIGGLTFLGIRALSGGSVSNLTSLSPILKLKPVMFIASSLPSSTKIYLCLAVSTECTLAK